MRETSLMEDLPLRKFHFRVVMAGSGGQFSDGFIMGIIGIAASVAATPLGLNAAWMGLIGAASLAGLFLGSLFAGPIADRFGRRGIFAYDMIVFAAISAAQFFVNSPWQLLTFRIVLGIVLGADYAVGKSLVIEYLPRQHRGRMISLFAVAWAGGYVAAYCAGFAIDSISPGAWRVMLALSGLPALLILPFRMGIPESPLWLAKKGRTQESLIIIRNTFGQNVTTDFYGGATPQSTDGGWAALFSPKLRRNTFVGCVFFTCQVIPYFALGTFSPTILQALHVKNGPLGAVVYNALLIAGTLIGVALIDRIPRRTFLICSFYSGALVLALLATMREGTGITIALFGIFACILAASTNLEYVYTAELFPTELRATGSGFVIACSRFGSAAATFLLPLAVQHLSIQAALLVCVGTLAFGGLICQMLAPETRNKKLGGPVLRQETHVARSDRLSNQRANQTH
ncbi:MFS transporter [Burkholderia sp. MR1-5-21]